VPLVEVAAAMVITKTNVRDDKLLAATPDAIIVSVRSQPKKLFNICLDTP